MGPMPADAQAPEYSAAIRKRAEKVLGELMRTIKACPTVKTDAVEGVEVMLPPARELIPKEWPERTVRQTTWERFAQSKGIGKLV
eukprot:15160_5